MKLAILLVPAAFFIISYGKSRSISNPYVAFNALWVAVSALINVGNKYVYEPTSTALACVLVGIVAFNLSMFTPKLVWGKDKLFFNFDEYYIDYKLAYIISIIVFVLSTLNAVGAIRAVISGASFADIRTDYYDVASGGSTIIYYFRNYVLSPLRYVVIISAIIGTIKRESNRLLLINAIGIVVFQAVTSGGRYVLMNTIFMIICGYSLFGDKEKITVKQKSSIVMVVLLFSYLILFLTNDRISYLTQDMTVGERLYHTVYEYFAGSTTYLGELSLIHI